MNDESQVTCPECQTSQSAEAPFCENCGYRIRRSDTVKEGHHVVTPEVLRRAREKRLEQSGAHQSDRHQSDRHQSDRHQSDGHQSDDRQPDDPQSSERAAESQDATAEPPEKGPAAGDGLSDDARDSADRVRPASDPHPAGADGSAKGPRTYIEGLRSVDPRDGEAEQGRAAQSAEFPSAASQSSLIDRPVAADTSGKLTIYVAIWLSITAVAILATYFLTVQLAEEQSRAMTPSDIPARVDVAEGPFLRGLEGDVRSFMLQMCQKVDEDPKENCKQKKLLKGEYPAETVELGAFQIDATEVTVADFKACADAGTCTPIDYKACEVWTHQGLQIALRVPKVLRRSEMPVTCVNLEQASAYCEWAGGKLPSSDQWEKTARGTKGKLFPWGTSWSSEIANWGEMDIAQSPIVGKLDGFERTAPPASFPKGKSPFGAYDMAGNVAEWVDTGQTTGAAARGGSWTSHPFDLRTTHRLELDAGAQRTDVGFRCAYE